MKRIGLIFIFYLILSCALLWPLPLRLSTSVINAGDPLFYAWNFIHNWQAATSGLRGILDTNIYYPTTNTLAFSDTLFTQTVLMSPVLALTGNPLLAQNLYIILTFPIAAIGTYLLVYYLTHHSWAALLSGLFFAFSYTRLGQISHVPAGSSQWFPFLFLLFIRFIDSGKWRDAIASMIFFILLVGSTVYFAVFGAVAFIMALVFYSFVLAKEKKFHLVRSRIVRLLLLLIPTLVIIIAINFPYIRLKIEHPDFKRSIEEASSRGAYQEDYYSVLSSSTLFANLLPVNEGERTLFPTFTLLALTLLFIRIKKKPKHILFFVVLTAVSFILSFGPDRPFHIGNLSTGYIRLPYYYAYKLFPLLQIIRVPARFSVLTVLGLSVIAGYSITSFNRRIGTRPFYMLVAAVFLLEIWQKPLLVVRVPDYAHLPAVYEWLKNQPDGPMVELPIGSIEMGETPIQMQIRKAHDEVNENDPLATEAYRTYFSGYHKKQMINGYSGLVPQSYHDAVAKLQEFPSPESIAYLKNFRIEYIIVHTAQYKTERRQKLLDNLLTQPDLKLLTSFGQDMIFTLQSN